MYITSMQYLWPFGAIKKETKEECAKWTHIFIFQTSIDYHLYSNRPLKVKKKKKDKKVEIKTHP